MAPKNGKKKEASVTPTASIAHAASLASTTNALTKNLSSMTISEISTKKVKRNIVKEFDDYFGADNLESWKRLCRHIGVDIWEQLSTKKECKKALVGIWVNIYDLLDAVQVGKPVKRFPNESALAKYTMATRKIYPKKKAKREGPVRALLAHIF